MNEQNPSEQREALKRSEKAARSQPENFKDEATDDKIVEIDPIGQADDAIKGIDPEKAQRPKER